MTRTTIPIEVLKEIEKEAMLYTGPRGMWSLEGQKICYDWLRDGYIAGATAQYLKSQNKIEAANNLAKAMNDLLNNLEDLGRQLSAEAAIKQYNESI